MGERLPLLLSVPHAGVEAPFEVAPYSVLGRQDIIADGDEGAAEIYWPLEERVSAFLTTTIARAFVDLNRAEDDFRKDGVIKTHTCWDVPVYRGSLPEQVIEDLLERYHRPYHLSLRDLARNGVILGVDCHTMAAVAPPVAPDPGQDRPAVCLGDADGSLPASWRDDLVDCFKETFAPHKVTLNDPFSGGYITRTHAAELPFAQLELSRGPYMTNDEKRRAVLWSFITWCDLRNSGS